MRSAVLEGKDTLVARIRVGLLVAGGTAVGRRRGGYLTRSRGVFIADVQIVVDKVDHLGRNIVGVLVDSMNTSGSTSTHNNTKPTWTSLFLQLANLVVAGNIFLTDFLTPRGCHR